MFARLQLVYVSGRLKLMGGEQYLVTVVRPVNPTPISEIPMEANLFVTNYDMNMECTYYDGRSVCVRARMSCICLCVKMPVVVFV